jgi:hypothetical protein
MRLLANERAFLHRAIRREALASYDPFSLGVLRTLVQNLPRRACGLSSLQLMALSELLLDASDTVTAMSEAVATDGY